MTIPNLGNYSIVHSVSRAQSEFSAGVVEYIDCASLGVGELCSLGYDGGQDRFEVDGRIHRLGDVAERTQLLDRARQLVQQARVLDGNDSLGGEIAEKLDLLFRE